MVTKQARDDPSQGGSCYACLWQRHKSSQGRGTPRCVNGTRDGELAHGLAWQLQRAAFASLPPFVSRAKEVSSCNISCAGSSYCGDSRIITLAGICLEEQVLVGLERYLIPKDLRGMHLCLSSHALTLCRRATAPWGGVLAARCLGARACGWPRVKASYATGRRW